MPNLMTPRTMTRTGKLSPKWSADGVKSSLTTLSLRRALLSRKSRAVILWLIVVLTAPTEHGRSAERSERLNGIVLIIADGTSLELITATRDYAVGAAGRLALEDFPHTAFVRTYSASDLVTDSGASATAMARGIKADNRVIGMARPGEMTGPPSILDLAKRAGWSTAVITDDSVTGATPASFVVEHDNRDQHEIIAAKLLDQLGRRVDIVVGGGSKWFFDRVEDPQTIYRAGERAAVQKTEQRLSKLPVAVFDDWEAFRPYNPAGADQKPVLGLFFPDLFPYYADGGRNVRLKDLVEKTVSLLRARGKPFFLLIEAALPDKACHLNNAKRAIVEVLELDAVVAWLRQNLSASTLLLATTDHNTGGFCLNGPFVPVELRNDALLGTNPLTGVSYFTWASGPGADRGTATKRTRIITETGKPLRSVEEVVHPTDADYAQPALIEGKASFHTAGDVWLLGEGPGSENVRGFLDNTRIFELMANAIEHSAH
jgi:alkaline phosphatase